MTHYILAGGSDRNYEKYAQKLSETVRGWLTPAPKVLSIQFAKDQESWKEIFEGWIPMFRRYFGKDMEAQLALPETLLEQIDWADVVYIHGGRTNNLLAVINSFEGIEKNFSGKVVIGSSAGTNFLSKTYFSPKQNVVEKGSGIVPLNTMVHYGSPSISGEVFFTDQDWVDAVDKMKSMVGDEEITLIPEGEFVVFEK